CQQYNGLPYSF
nr:immunoglobulin light chain junction region [Macaca mulatta]MOW35272.1 immunoglobulin light chain junction region [Macaca mulatta]MOX84768.1 immunoglobulin light chain junction region [Macaca mulatta]MOX84930.1 immunoglobulin light chain junction region [Macaca mulatta]MOX85387.1 immunoglobulin light chain junction region [Macaca mulatta]